MDVPSWADDEDRDREPELNILYPTHHGADLCVRLAQSQLRVKIVRNASHLQKLQYRNVL